MAKPPLPSFPKIAEIVGEAETAQETHDQELMKQAQRDQVDRGEEFFGTGFESKLTRGGLPWHLEAPNPGPKPGDYDSMDPANMSSKQKEQQGLLDNFKKAPRHARRAIVAARAYSGDSPRTWSEHPLVEGAPNSPVLTPEGIYLRWIGWNTLRHMEAAQKRRIQHSHAVDQGNHLQAKWFKWRMERRERAARSIGDYLTDDWRENL